MACVLWCAELCFDVPFRAGVCCSVMSCAVLCCVVLRRAMRKGWGRAPHVTTPPAVSFGSVAQSAKLDGMRGCVEECGRREDVHVGVGGSASCMHSTSS